MAKGVRPVNPEALLVPRFNALERVQVNDVRPWMSSGFLFWFRWSLILAYSVLALFSIAEANTNFLRGLGALILSALAVQITGYADGFAKSWRLLVGLVAAVGAILLIS